MSLGGLKALLGLVGAFRSALRALLTFFTELVTSHSFHCLGSSGSALVAGNEDAAVERILAGFVEAAGLFGNMKQHPLLRLSQLLSHCDGCHTLLGVVTCDRQGEFLESIRVVAVIRVGLVRDV
jgi:hypothetical protein